MIRHRARLIVLFVALAAASAARPEAYGSFMPTVPQIVVQGPPPPGDAIIAWNRDGSLLATASVGRGALQLWDTRTGNLVTAVPLPAFDRINPPTSGDFVLAADGSFAEIHTNRDAQHCLTYRIDLAGNGPTMGTTSPGHFDCSHYADRLVPGPGGRRLVETDGSARIVAPGRWPVALAAEASRTLVDIAVTPDATTMVMLATTTSALLDTPDASVVEVWSLTTGMRSIRLRVPGYYARVRWLGTARFVLFGTDAGRLTPAPTLIVDAASGRIVDRVAFRCFAAPLGTDGALIASRVAPCSLSGVPEPGQTPPGLWVRAAHQAWRRLTGPALAGVAMDTLATTPDGRRTVVLTPRTIIYEHPGAADQGELLTDQTRVVLIDGDPLVATPPAVRVLPVKWLSDNERAGSVRFMADGARVLVETDRRYILVRLADGHQYNLPPETSGLPDELIGGRVIADDGHSIVTAAYDELGVRLTYVDGTGGFPVATEGTVLAAGFVAGDRLMWTAGFDGSLHINRVADGAPVLVMQSLGAKGFVAYDPTGRYDSSLGPDGNAFRWRMADEPLRSLGGQTFLRDYYEPQLFAKTLACAATDSCAAALPALPPVAGLNRTLPAVRIAAIRPGPGASAIVDVEVRSTDAPAANGKTHSGMYDLHLFRDGKLVAQAPTAPSATVALDRAGWQRASALAPGRDGVFRQSFRIRLPTGLSARHAVFTAYAFNDDRVKSDTARAVYDRPWVWPTQRKAYILTIGVNDYAQARFNLNFAAADADLLAARLRQIPGYAVHRLDLRGAGKQRQATTQAIADALALLGPGDHPTARAGLRELGVDPSGFATATPDDLVVVTFAGHGWADPTGNFYLVPSDESWPDGRDAPDLAHLISAAQLTDWLRPVDFGDAAIVIDACNSAAVVEAAGFKPGPLGDRGLGQLAYDKGILILAASQTDQKAHEDAKLGHGFLTAALARDGLDGNGFGQADLNGDGVITLDEWLRYAVERLPTLSAEVAATGRGRDFAPTADALAPVAAAVPQVPSLFDFTDGPSPVILGQEPWRARLTRFGGTVAGWGRAAGAWLSFVRHLATDTAYGVLAAVAVALAAGVFLLVRWLWRVARRRFAAVN